MYIISFKSYVICGDVSVWKHQEEIVRFLTRSDCSLLRLFRLAFRFLTIRWNSSSSKRFFNHQKKKKLERQKKLSDLKYRICLFKHVFKNPSSPSLSFFFLPFFFRQVLEVASEPLGLADQQRGGHRLPSGPSLSFPWNFCSARNSSFWREIHFANTWRSIVAETPQQF